MGGLKSKPAKPSPARGLGEERLQKIIARAGIASRRRAEQMIAEGRVTVNHRVVTELGTRCDPNLSEVRVDGVPVRPRSPRRYLLLNKPRGYLTTRSDPGRRPTVMDLLPRSLKDTFPVGRLDFNTSGVLLLTDDGDFALRVAHPRYRVQKTYRATVRGEPDELTLAALRRGVSVDGERLKADSVTVLERGSESRLRVVLHEGKNRELHRLFAALGFPVLRLHREKVGAVSDRGLPLGAFRRLTAREVRQFLGASVTS
jgi:pseudouridine synthase